MNFGKWEVNKLHAEDKSFRQNTSGIHSMTASIDVGTGNCVVYNNNIGVIECNYCHLEMVATYEVKSPKQYSQCYIKDAKYHV